MHIHRQSRRIAVDIPVTVTTVLDNFDAGITDLSEHGAQIVGCAVPRAMRVHVEYMGQTIFAQCHWTEVDRMGVKFLFPLTHGPLYERLTIALATCYVDGDSPGLHPAFTPTNEGQATRAARTFNRVLTPGPFGRRN